MNLPVQLIQSLHDAPGFEKEPFERAHEQPAPVSIRVNKLKPFDPNTHFPGGVSRVPWTDSAFYLSERPSFTFDPIFHAGCYYVQEASSMMVGQALLQHADVSRKLKVLDLCAAPGGKSTHIQSLISKESLLVSNEVIRSRSNVLKDNIIKWGSNNVVITNNDPRDFVRLENFFDVIVVDAPCSGSGLFRREPGAMEEWSADNVALCSQRQRRILADVWPALKKDGILVYSTCSYSQQEDEEIAAWLEEEKNATYLPLKTEESWGLTDTGKGYRCWPDKVKGEGFFIACFRKTGGEEESDMRIKKKATILSKAEREWLNRWVVGEELQFIKHEQTVYAWPSDREDAFNWLLNNLRVVYSGTIIGELMRDKLVPDHALAMSNLAAPGIQRQELTPDQSIAYLQRKDMSIETSTKGWQLVTYANHPLGWINALPNRINNYYPKELRILKDK